VVYAPVLHPVVYAPVLHPEVYPRCTAYTLRYTLGVYTGLYLPTMPPYVYIQGYTSLLCLPVCIRVYMPGMPPWVCKGVYAGYASLGV